MKTKLLLLASCLVVLTTGCVAGRRTLLLTVPSLGTATAAPTKGDVFVSAPADHRVFVNDPSNPSTPSIDGDVTTMAPGQKDIMIGRQRNAYGHAMGDIGLPPEQTVTGVALQLVQQGFKDHGYTLSTNPASPTGVSVSIDEFWAWSTPGMFSVPFEAEVSCRLTIKGKTGTPTELVIRGHGLNEVQVASDENWQLAYSRAFSDFLIHLNSALDKAGL